MLNHRPPTRCACCAVPCRAACLLLPLCAACQGPPCLARWLTFSLRRAAPPPHHHRHRHRHYTAPTPPPHPAAMRPSARLPPTVRRFVLLLAAAAAIILVPTFLYVEHTAVYDPSALEWAPLPDARPTLVPVPGAPAPGPALFHPAGQVGQGRPIGYPTRFDKVPTFFEACLMNPNVRWVDLAACDRARTHLRADPPPPPSTPPPASASSSAAAPAPPAPTAATTLAPAASAPATGPKDTVDPNGLAIMPQMGNATAKALLGRATWHFLHTMTLRYPDTPTDDDKKMLRDFFHLFSRLYPCGDCANHFQGMLARFPPQVGSRKSASLWLCSLHNKVNARLHKPEFDCGALDQTYDCGCGPDPDAPEPAASPIAARWNPFDGFDDALAM